MDKAKQYKVFYVAAHKTERTYAYRQSNGGVAEVLYLSNATQYDDVEDLIEDMQAGGDWSNFQIAAVSERVSNKEVTA